MSVISAVLGDGALTGILDLTNGVVLFTAPVGTPFNSRSSVERFPSGLFAFGNFTALTGPLAIWRWNSGALFTQLATVTPKPVAITSNSVANPSVVTSAKHFLTSGQTVTIAGVVGSVPDINGTQVVTVLSPTTFSVPKNVTTGGTGGTVTASMAGKWYALSANGANVWTADTSSGVTTPLWQKFDQTGTGLLTQGPITALVNSVRAMTPALDESVMYYSAGLTGAPIKQWNLTTNLIGADVVSPADIVTGLWPVPGSTDIVALTERAYDGISPVAIKVIRYTTAGAVVYTATVYTFPATATETRLDVARDPSLTSIWIRTAAAPAYTQATSSVYLNVDLIAGGILSTTTIPTTVNIGYTTPSYGAPFLIMSSPGVSGSPGSPGTPCGSFT